MKQRLFFKARPAELTEEEVILLSSSSLLSSFSISLSLSLFSISSSSACSSHSAESLGNTSYKNKCFLSGIARITFIFPIIIGVLMMLSHLSLLSAPNSLLSAPEQKWCLKKTMKYRFSPTSARSRSRRR